jgi:ABC-type spermidine/putrescine transport system permease subunit II
MDIAAFSVDASHLLLGAFATFCAILLWSRTRDMAWTFVIIGVIITYADIVMATLRSYGLLGPEPQIAGGVPIVRILLANLPLVFLGVGFLVAFARRGTH